MSGDEHVLARRRFLAFGHGAAPVIEEIPYQALSILRRGNRRRDRRVEVMHHAVAIGERGVVGSLEGEAARRRLLVGHADRAVEHRPGVAVAGIERVVDLADEIEPPALIETGGVGAAEEVESGDLALGDVRIERIGGRREVIGVVAALLVQVDGYFGEVLAKHLHAASRLGLRLGEPVAVHIEEIVVRAPTRPWLVVLGVVRGGVGSHGARLQVLEQEAGATVGILHRIDQYQRVAQHEIHVGVPLRGEQVIRLLQRGIRRRDLVAVHPVGEPDHGGQVAHQPLRIRRREVARVGEALQIGLDLIELRDPLGAADDHEPERTAFPRPGVFAQACARRRGFGKRLEILADLLATRPVTAGGTFVGDGIAGEVISRPGSWPTTCLSPGIAPSYPAPGQSGSSVCAVTTAASSTTPHAPAAVASVTARRRNHPDDIGPVLSIGQRL